MGAGNYGVVRFVQQSVRRAVLIVCIAASASSCGQSSTGSSNEAVTVVVPTTAIAVPSILGSSEVTQPSPATTLPSISQWPEVVPVASPEALADGDEFHVIDPLDTASGTILPIDSVMDLANVGFANAYISGGVSRIRRGSYQGQPVYVIDAGPTGCATNGPPQYANSTIPYAPKPCLVALLLDATTGDLLMSVEHG